MPPSDDPTSVIAYHLRDQWALNGSYSHSEAPEFHTGRWSRAQKFPNVAVWGKQEDVIRGGETGLSASHGSTGKEMQLVGGHVFVSLVAGVRGGVDSNPKKVRYELEQWTNDTLLSDPPSGFQTIAPDTGRDLEDDGASGEEDVVYLHRLRARYTYKRLPTK